MRSVDERVAAVRRRSKKIRRRRSDTALIVLVCLMALPLVDLAGRTVTGGALPSLILDENLFGAASLFGSSVGGYVLVAVISFALAVLVTAFILLRRKSSSKQDGLSQEDEKPSVQTNSSREE